MWAVISDRNGEKGFARRKTTVNGSGVSISRMISYLPRFGDADSGSRMDRKV